MSFKRTDRINEEVKKELSSIIRDLKDPRIPMMTSVVTVNVTNDLRYAKAYISVMGTDEEKKDAIKGLKAAAGSISDACPSFLLSLIQQSNTVHISTSFFTI